MKNELNLSNVHVSLHHNDFNSELIPPTLHSQRIHPAMPKASRIAPCIRFDDASAVVWKMDQEVNVV